VDWMHLILSGFLWTAVHTWVAGARGRNSMVWFVLGYFTGGHCPGPVRRHWGTEGVGQAGDSVRVGQDGGGAHEEGVRGGKIDAD
jgi:hypothetical protein